MVMDAARLKRARWRLRTYFFGSGIIMAFVFLMLAAFVISLFGVASTSYVTTLIFAAGVMAGGAYAIIFLGAVLVHVVRKALARQPIWEAED